MKKILANIPAELWMVTILIPIGLSIIFYCPMFFNAVEKTWAEIGVKHKKEMRRLYQDAGQTHWFYNPKEKVPS